MKHSPTWWTARLSLAAVTGIAGIASYLHALIVVQAADPHSVVALFIPVLADLVIASAAANLLDASRSDKRLPRLSMAAAVVGVAVTLAANVESGTPHAVPVWCVNVWPPVAFVLALESLVGHVRRSRETVSRYGHPADDGQPEAGPLVVADELQRLVEHFGSQRKTSDALGIPRDRLRRLVAPPVAVAELNGHVDA